MDSRLELSAIQLRCRVRNEGTDNRMQGEIRHDGDVFANVQRPGQRALFLLWRTAAQPSLTDDPWHTIPPQPSALLSAAITPRSIGKLALRMNGVAPQPIN